jgi:hypothetical protein
MLVLRHQLGVLRRQGLTTSVPDRRSSPAGGGQPRTASSPLVVLPREARDAAALAPTADRPRLDPLPPPAKTLAGATSASRATCSASASKCRHHDPHLHASSRVGSCTSAGGYDLAGVPVPAGRWDQGVRFLHRRHDLATAVVCAVLHRVGHSASPPGWRDRPPRGPLDCPAGPQLLLVGWNRQIHQPVQSPPARSKGACIAATALEGCSASTNGEPHERVSAPYGELSRYRPPAG